MYSKIFIYPIIFFSYFITTLGQDQGLQKSQINLKKANTLVGVPQELQSRCFSFFDEILNGNIESAFDKLLLNSPMSEKKEQIANLISQVKRSVELYGSIKDYEPVSAEIVTESLIKVRFLGLHDNFPLRWLITFYKSPKNGWVVINIKFDELSEYFFTDE